VFGLEKAQTHFGWAGLVGAVPTSKNWKESKWYENPAR
jgi:hypothetical protein